MRHSSVQDTGRYDCVFVSPHAGDAVESCVARIAWEVSRGMRVLVATLFGERSVPDPVIEGLGADEIAFDLPTAAARSVRYSRLSSRLEEHLPEDRALLEAATTRLDALAQAVKPRHVYVPLAVGGQVDHRLAHGAAMRGLAEAPGREVFLYEDRPYSCLRGAVWVRLGQLGARLPPAVRVTGRSNLLAFLLRFQTAAYVRGQAAGMGDRFASTLAAARQWGEARHWHPRRAHGPRFQPVDHVLEAGKLDALQGVLSGRPAPRCMSRDSRNARAGTVRPGRTERYWLLLPALEGDHLPVQPELADVSHATAGPPP